MKAGKTLFIQFEDWGLFKSRVTRALRDKNPSVAKRNTLIFESVSDYQKFMTEHKLAILATVANRKPASIYQLAKLVDRDFAAVHRDCVALVAQGFMRLHESGDSKKTKAPRLAFEYTRIEIHMPQVTYSHDLGNAA